MTIDALINATTGDATLVETLLSQGIDINGQNIHGTSPLIWAAYNGNINVVRLLLKKGANIDLRTSHGHDALYIAKDRGHHETVQVLEEARELAYLKSLEPTETWVLMAPQKIAHVGNYPSIGQKLTTVFNFESRQTLVIVDDLLAKSKAVTPLTDFDDLKQPAQLEQALKEFVRQGGVANEAFVLRGVSRLDKQA